MTQEKILTKHRYKHKIYVKVVKTVNTNETVGQRELWKGHLQRPATTHAFNVLHTSTSCKVEVVPTQLTSYICTLCEIRLLVDTPIAVWNESWCPTVDKPGKQDNSPSSSPPSSTTHPQGPAVRKYTSGMPESVTTGDAFWPPPVDRWRSLPPFQTHCKHQHYSKFIIE